MGNRAGSIQLQEDEIREIQEETGCKYLPCVLLPVHISKKVFWPVVDMDSAFMWLLAETTERWCIEH